MVETRWFGETPPSTAQVSGYFAKDGQRRIQIVVGTESLPREVVTEVVINPHIDRLLCATPYQDQAPDWQDVLFKLARFTVPFRQSAPDGGHAYKNILTPMFWGRSIPVAEGDIPYADGLVGRFVFQKGLGVSGMRILFGAGNPSSPMGFFGHRDAEREMAVSNALLAHGARSTLALGYIALDGYKLQNLFVRHWRQQEGPQAEDMRGAIQMVMANGDTPVALFRVGATRERLQATVSKMNAREKLYVRAMHVQAARVWQEEQSLFPDRFTEYLAGIELKTLQTVLQKLSNYKSLQSQETDTFRRFIGNMLSKDFIKTQQVAKELHLAGLEDEYLLGTKDIDFALVHTDFETANIKTHSQRKSKWKEKIADMQERYLSTLAAVGLTAVQASEG